MEVRNVSVESLVEYARNPRKNDTVVDRMVSCIKEFGFRIPIVAKSDGTVVDGHLRLKAARKLGMTEVPTVNADDLTEAQIKAFRLAANQSANWAEWDEELLKLEFKDLEDLDFDLELTGFDLDDIQRRLDELETGEIVEDDFDESEMMSDESEVITKPGDLWIIGEHRLLCGDSTKIEDVERLTDGKRADMLFTDPPYGYNYQSNRREKSKKFEVLKNDDRILDFLPNIKNICNGFVFVCVSWKTLKEWLSVFSASFQLTNMIIWFKGGGGIGDLEHTFSTDYEIILCSNNGAKLKGKRLGSVWNVRKDNAINYVHATQKPVALSSLAIESCSNRKNIVLDLFGGSGSTLIACEETKRKCYMMELDPRYCDVIIRRWQKLTGQQAILESNGKTFDELFEEDIR